MTDAIPKMLAMLAEQSGEQVSKHRLEFIVRSLAAHADARVVAGLEKLLKTSRRFPTLGEIEAAMGVGEPTDADKGREVGERIYTAIGRWGTQSRNNWPAIAEYIGPIGVKVVEMQGGWQQVCETTDYDNAGMLKAQWRELAAVLARKEAAGTLDEAPKFAKLPEGASAAIGELGAKLSLNPRGGGNAR